jgi:hypothetical protein
MLRTFAQQKKAAGTPRYYSCRSQYPASSLLNDISISDDVLDAAKSAAGADPITPALSRPMGTRLVMRTFGVGLAVIPLVDRHRDQSSRLELRQ